MIAILAAAVIPTFTSVVGNAKKSSALQECRNTYTEFLTDAVKASGYDGNAYIEYVDGDITYEFYVVKGEFTDTTSSSDTGWTQPPENYVTISKITIYVDYEVDGTYYTTTEVQTEAVAVQTV